MKIVIVGAGEVGFNIAKRLAEENKDVVVVDNNMEAIRRVSDTLDVQVVQGSGGSPLALEEAGIRDAEILLAVTNSDEINLVACLSADILSPGTRKLARIRAEDYDQYHKSFQVNTPHIDTIINPEIELVRTIDRMMSISGAIDVEEFADGNIKLIGVRLNGDTPITGLRLSEFPNRVKNPPLIAAVVRNEELIIPRGDDHLLEGDLVYFIGMNDNLAETMSIFNKQAETMRRVVIVGGGRVGFRLAKLLEEKSIHIKIIEKDPARCNILAERLNKAIVLHGDGSDQQLLIEENIQETDAVVTLTGDEETNILISLLAKRMGVQKAITRITRFTYFPLMLAIGMEQVVNSRLSAINSILKYIRRGKILSARSLKGEQGEVIEAVALETSDIVGKPLKDISLPKGSLVAGIMRKDNIIIPSGASVINPGDRVILFARKQAVSKIEKILTVKLEYV